jgi:hypothetical protein
MNPIYPVYIISKGRSGPRPTSRFLEKEQILYRIVIEPQEYDQYAAVIDPAKILVLPFSNLGQGSIPARNWVWEHSISESAARHWILDDNISGLSYFNNNQRHYYRTGAGLAIMEQFADRYENVALCGPQYDFFMPKRVAHKDPLILNTRVYSFILIDNSLPFRWRGRYNEDTDLSLRCLKAGYCTVLFMAFLQKKAATMTMKGGNTESLYKLDNEDGRYLMAESLRQQHPDVTKITRKWGRWQHHVDYRPFKHNKLIKREGIEIPQGVNNYGMRLVKREETKRPAEAGQGVER